MKRSYHTIDKQGKVGERKLAEFLVRNGQALLPMIELIEQSRMAIDELIDVMGRAVSRPSWDCRPAKWPVSHSRERPGPARSAGMEHSRDG